ncbi:M14 family metallopeptidase [Alkalihalobacterium elongatum]|uniref:M14 family metallopeptidase n=1 Tax=Alkalihalobacterium elongatum TaxID=2675466 RepID=UPI001C1F384B|nr:M14 family metallopeptidase [Alkalihalobacterium elongatum]
MRAYTVKKGDTIRKVAVKFGIRPFDLLLFNRHVIHENSYIYPGEVLEIPEIKKELAKKYSPFQCLCEYGPVDMEMDVNLLHDNYLDLISSEFLSIDTIGESVLSHPILSFKIGNGKKKIFYSGGWHANEWLTSKFLMTFIKELLVHYKKKQRWHGYELENLFKQVTLYIVPLVNPDGVELVQQGIYSEHPMYKEVLTINKGCMEFNHWSSNIRGVDLNHQWPAGWEIEADESPQQPWPRHYSGTAPLTEPEARAIYDFTRLHDFSHVLAFHSQGQVIYWGYRGYEPPESKEMVERLSLVSSYVPVHTAESDGGYKDWFIQETRRPGFTIEVGVGTNPLPLSSFSEIWSNNVLLALEGLIL